jgi:hypothetical protein
MSARSLPLTDVELAELRAWAIRWAEARTGPEYVPERVLRLIDEVEQHRHDWDDQAAAFDAMDRASDEAEARRLAAIADEMNRDAEARMYAREE